MNVSDIWVLLAARNLNVSYNFIMAFFLRSQNNRLFSVFHLYVDFLSQTCNLRVMIKTPREHCTDVEVIILYDCAVQY